MANVNNKDNFRKGANNRKNNRSNKRNNRSRNQNAKDSEVESKYQEEANKGKTRVRNSPDWYGSSSVLMQDAARVPFSFAAGMPYDLNNDKFVISNNCYNPGIMVLDYISTPGTATDWSSPVNVAIRDMYTFIRHANSGHSNYNAANLGMYLMAYDAALSYYAWMVRIYGVMRSVMPRNRYTPEAIVTAMGVDYDDVAANLAQFRAYINTFSARLFALKVPDKFSIINRHMWMNSHIFLDSPTDKAQFYFYNPRKFWKYTLGPTPEETGMFLYVDMPYLNVESALTCANMYKFGEELLNSILNDEDFNIMSGDIKKAYGDNVFVVSTISEDYAVVPVYEPEALLQLHNATICNTQHFDSERWSIREDYSESPNVGALVNNFYIPLNKMNAYTVANKILDIPLVMPDHVHVALATRLMFNTEITSRTFGESTTAATVLQIKQCGSEVIVNARIITRSGSNTYVEDDLWNSNVVNTDQNIEVFNMHPFIVEVFGYTGNAEQISGQRLIIHGDMDNCTVVPTDVLDNIHRAALLGMYGMTK